MRNAALALLAFCLTLPPVSQASLPPTVAGQALPSLAPMLEQATPAVVNIATKSTIDAEAHPLMRDPFFRYFFGTQPRKRPNNSLGSGVIVDAQKGYVLTNHHVVKDADVITVGLKDGRQVEAKLVGTDPDTDVAVLRIKPERLSALPLADSSQLRVGDFVVAIGNPFALGHSVTSGIVSALGRSGLGIEQYEDFIQTDAAINPGNSGGALVNLRGELVGINTAILAPGGGNVGIGFAIPINQARGLMAQLIEHGEVRRGLLAIDGDSLNPELAQALGVSVQQGLIVSDVAEGSTAEAAGLKPYDVITAIDGRPVRGKQDLFNFLGLQNAGATVSLRIQRGEDQRELAVRLESERSFEVEGADVHPLFEGARLGNPRPGRQDGPGVHVRGVAGSSVAARLGLKPGDVILAINRYRTRDLDELRELAGNSQRVLAINILRGGNNLLLTVR
ncbi:MAG: DegQ family serine endoprotease [Gammaproteobacteria bacterium]|nr:DegQ family serine endoprotease [Gammaproteobacteria bacterium]